MSLDVALVSCARLPEPDLDAEPLLQALAGAGLSAKVLAWDEAGVDWSEPRITVLRSSWNYPHHLDEFLAWAEAVSRVSDLWNPLPVITWNVHKKYLLDLERQGVPVTPTVLLKRGAGQTLLPILQERGWSDAVIKPAVSASSFKTLRVGSGQEVEGEKHLRRLLEERDVLVQQFLPSVEDHGERALIWIDGSLTHAVRKSPRFERDDEWVSPAAVAIAPEEAALARRALEAAPRPLLYARIDMTRDADGSPLLMELELVEPSLYFTQSPASLAAFVAAVQRVVQRSD